MSDDERVLTMAEAAAILGITVSTLRRWCREGHIEYVRINARGDRRFKNIHVQAASRPKITGRPKK